MVIGSGIAAWWWTAKPSSYFKTLASLGFGLFSLLLRSFFFFFFGPE